MSSSTSSPSSLAPVQEDDEHVLHKFGEKEDQKQSVRKEKHVKILTQACNRIYESNTDCIHIYYCVLFSSFSMSPSSPLPPTTSNKVIN